RGRRRRQDEGSGDGGGGGGGNAGMGVGRVYIASPGYGSFKRKLCRVQRGVCIERRRDGQRETADKGRT
ncbi:hypothetical protein ALC56_14803, partial [Trachymyrmex septentrionalis]